MERGIRFLDPDSGDEMELGKWYDTPVREQYHFNPFMNWVNDPNGPVSYTHLDVYKRQVMKTGNKVVLFETAKARFFDEYLEKLKAVIDVTRIDYLVTSHTEPDHAGSVERLLDYSPQMKILATPCAISFLKEIVNRDFVSIAVKDDQRTVSYTHLGFPYDELCVQQYLPRFCSGSI